MPVLRLKRATAETVKSTTLFPGDMAVATDTGEMYVSGNTGNVISVTETRLDGSLACDLDDTIETAEVDPGHVGPFKPTELSISLASGDSFDRNSATMKGLTGDVGSVGQPGPTGEIGPTGEPGLKTYDIIIRTQAEFDELITSYNWLGATSVLFVGQSDSTFYHRISNSYDSLIIPMSVKRIDGIGNPTIWIDIRSSDPNLSEPYNSPYGVIGYVAEVTSDEYSLSGIKFKIESDCCPGRLIALKYLRNVTDCIVTVGNIDSGCAFQYCSKLRNCYAMIDCQGENFGAETAMVYSCGFDGCHDLIGCHIEIKLALKDEGLPQIGFDNCERLINCSASFDKRACTSFYRCNYLVNCRTVATSASGGFVLCNRLQNCYAISVTGCFNNCHQLSNCVACNTDTYTVGFYDCDYLDNCTLEPKGSIDPSHISLYNNPPTHIDNNTCSRT